MGNRGILHNDAQQIRHQWSHNAWVCCELEFNNVKRTLFAPNNYSELFFLDEATSFAAGHRPCNTCRHERHAEFKQSWLRANRPERAGNFVKMSEIDGVLHAERAIRGGGKQTFAAQVQELPHGTMFDHNGLVYLSWKRGPLRWSFEGYSPATALPPDSIVRVLTPMSIVRMFSNGFEPCVHHTADTGTI
jgi:hypothetical protein